MRPLGVAITFSGTVSAVLYADSITSSTIYQNFQRDEFSNKRLASALNDAGGTPIIITTLGGQPLQIATTCTADSPRPLTPDSLTNLEAIYQRQNIVRYQIESGPSLFSGVDAMENLAYTHTDYLADFDFWQQVGNQANVSYNFLIDTVQTTSYSFLSSTGLTMSGNPIPGGSVSNVLIRDFKADVSYCFNNIGSGFTLIKSCSMTLDVVTISSQKS